MFKSKLLTVSTYVVLALVASNAAWASDPGSQTGLPGPGIVGLVAVAVIGAIAVARSRK